MALLLSDIPDCAFRVHVLSCLSLGDLVSLLLTERRFACPVRAAPQWDAATAELSRSNTFDVLVRERLEGNGDADISEHLLSDPRLDAAAYAALPAMARFKALAGFCRATVGHLRTLHNVWGEADWTFEASYEEHAATPRSLHINKLVALERRGKPHAFSRYKCHGQPHQAHPGAERAVQQLRALLLVRPPGRARLQPIRGQLVQGQPLRSLCGRIRG